MRKLLLAALLAAVPFFGISTSAYAQTGYVEGSIGFVLFPDIESNDYTFMTPSGLFAGNAETAIDSSWAFGAEAGFRTGAWRFGVSWDFIDAETDTARLEGTLDGSPFSFEASDADLEDFGLDANHDLNIFAANAYYMFNNFGAFGGGVQPYVGLGAGVAAFKDAGSEFAFLITLGANVPIWRNGYIGGRYRLALISGPTADNGIEFDGFTTHTFSIVLGFQFGV